MAPTLENVQVLLKSNPKGFPTNDDFEIVTASLSKEVTGPDDVLVQLLDLSVDPYLRGRMNAGASYIAPFELGRASDRPHCLQHV